MDGQMDVFSVVINSEIPLYQAGLTCSSWAKVFEGNNYPLTGFILYL
jgi:hypothetical protein